MHGSERLYLEALFAAYSAVWVLMFGFLHRMDRRTARLERDLALIKSHSTVATDHAAKPPLGGPSV